MESCRLPIELCEAVMNALPGCYGFGHLHGFENRRCHEKTVKGQRALCACALTCRAWRVRAQYLLLTFPYIRNHARLAHFIMTARGSPITGLTLGEYYNLPEPFDASKASELFMRPCLRLQHLRCVRVRFDRGSSLRLLRMRLSFFASITTLRLWQCTFHNFRAMMDVVWACPNLAMLDIDGAKFKVPPLSATGIRQMTAAVEHLRACQKLTSLYLDMDTLKKTWFPASAGLNGVGRVFGCPVTELYFEISGPLFDELLGTLLRDSFPALHSVTAASIFDLSRHDEEDCKLPLLHIVATDRPIPGTLKMIVLQAVHKHENNRCCKRVVGTSEKVVGSERWLPELLSGLAELTIRLDQCEDPERCARYIWSVLPGMRNVLRFEYCERMKDAWIPYTLPVAK